MSKYDYDDVDNAFEEKPVRRKRKKGLSSNGKWGIALLIELIIVVLMGYGVFRIYLHDKYQKFDHVSDMKEDDLEINEGVNEDMKGYTTIALFGVDSRDSNMGKGTRSDAIMIAAINNETKAVKIVSVYRDTLLEITKNNGGTVTTKVNAAYAYGGPELAVQTLNKNLDMNISEYITVNWEALTRAIDALGGVTIHVEENELPVLNAAVTEQMQSNGISSDGVYDTGYLTLNGVQATAYARIRNTDQGDITRTERQREVINAMLVQAKKSDLKTLNKIIDEVFPYVGTSITEQQMLDLVTGVMSYNLEDTVGFPIEFNFYNNKQKGSCIAPVDLNENVKAVQKFLFGTEDYTPTSTVQNISAEISSETGFASNGTVELPEKKEEPKEEEE